MQLTAKYAEEFGGFGTGIWGKFCGSSRGLGEAVMVAFGCHGAGARFYRCGTGANGRAER